MVGHPHQAPGRRRPHGRDRPRARAARPCGRAPDAHARRRRLGALHDRLGLRVERLPVLDGRRSRLRPDPHRRADRHRHRLPRRRGDHPAGGLGPRSDHRRRTLGRGRDRHGRRGRLLLGGAHRHGHRAGGPRTVPPGRGRNGTGPLPPSRALARGRPDARAFDQRAARGRGRTACSDQPRRVRGPEGPPPPAHPARRAAREAEERLVEDLAALEGVVAVRWNE